MSTDPLLYRFFQVPKESIHILKGIFESYEGMCVLSTVDREACEVQLTIARDFADEIDDVVVDLNRTIPMLEIKRDNQTRGHF